jgi:hypothetical protein
LLKRFVDKLKEFPDTSFKFHLKDCMIINITKFMTNRP